MQPGDDGFRNFLKRFCELIDGIDIGIFIYQELMQLINRIKTVQPDDGDNFFHLLAAVSGCDIVVRPLVDVLGFAGEIQDELVREIAGDGIAGGIAGLLINVGADYAMSKAMPWLPDLLEGVNNNGERPMHVAAKYGRKQMLDFFLMLGRHQKSRTTNNGDTIIHLAARSGNIETVKMLLKKRGGFFSARLPNTQNYTTAVHIAAERGDVDMLRILYEHNIADEDPTRRNFEMQDKDGYTPLCLAASCGHLDAVKFLIEHNADCSAHTNFGDTPLILASSNGALDVVNYMLTKTPDLADAKNSNGDTALHYAAKNRHYEVYDAIRRLKPSASTILNSAGQSPEQLAGGRAAIDCALEWIRTKAPTGEAVINESRHYDYALLSAAAFTHDGRSCGNMSDELVGRELLERHWIKLNTSNQIPEVDGTRGYFGAAYYKKIDNNSAILAISHQGTCKAGHVLADVHIMERKWPHILDDAFQYTRKICSNGVPGNMQIVEVMHTGFSLGGFIAAACTTLKHPNAQINAVTFDAPGIDYLYSRDVLETIAPMIVNYVTAPNLVNTCNNHVGEIRQLSVNNLVTPLENIQIELSSFVSLANQFTELLSEACNVLYTHDIEDIIKTIDHKNAYYSVRKWPRSIIQVTHGDLQTTQNNGKDAAEILSGLGSVVLHVFQQQFWNLTRNDSGLGISGITYERNTNNRIYYGTTIINTRFAANQQGFFGQAANVNSPGNHNIGEENRRRPEREEQQQQNGCVIQ